MVSSRRNVVRLFLAAALLLAPVVARAMPFDEYHERVDAALVILSDLYSESEEGETSDASDAESRLGEVRTLLPAKTTIETPEGAIEVDDSWIHDDLDAYAAGDEEQRSEILDRLTTRLTNLDHHLTKLHEAGARSTDDERRQLEQILLRQEFRDPSDSVVAKFMRDLRERLAKLLRTLLEALFGGEKGATFNSGLRAVILGAGAVALVLLGRALVLAFIRGRKTEKKPGKRTVLGEEIDETTTATDLADSARALAARGEYREAIRKLFVALLYQLDERGVVRLHSDATNREYLALVRDLSRLYPIMAPMTDTFDRVWYGRETVDRERYEAFAQQHAEAARIVDGAVQKV